MSPTDRRLAEHRDIALHPAASLSEFLRYCDAVGICLAIDRKCGGVKWQAPHGVMDEDLLHYLGRWKDQILAFLYEPAWNA